MRTLLLVVGLVIFGSASPVLGQAGTFDDTFGESGIATRAIGIAEVHLARGIAVQPDEHILLAGFARGLSSSIVRFGLTRLLPDGTLDLAFGDGGYAEAPFERSAGAHALALQPDGRAVAAGWTEVADGGRRAFALARFHTDGTPDLAFGDGGLVITPFEGTRDAEANAVAVQPDGRVLAAGSASDENGGFTVVRYLPDGTLDASFGDGGRIVVTSNSYSLAYAVAVDGQGRIVVTGGANGALVVMRFLNDGTPDPAFGTDGRVSHNPSASAIGRAITFQPPDDRIVVAGSVSDTGGGRDFLLVRLTENGALDPSFGEDGVVQTEFSGSSYAHAIVVVLGTRLLVAGQELGSSGAVLARYLPDGALDPAFGDGGRLRNVGLTDAWALSTASMRRIIVAGVVPLPGGGSGFAAARLSINGALDATFGEGGIAATRGLGTNRAFAADVAALPDGGVVIGGCAATPTTKGFSIARLDARGLFDASFGTDGLVITEFDAPACPSLVGVLPGGEVVAAGAVIGNGTGGLAAVRYRPDGSLDPTFGEEGRTTALPGFSPKTGRVFPDGSILAAGCVGGSMKLGRLLSDGTPDSAFGSGGLSVGVGGGCAHALDIRPDGRIVAVGHRTVRVTTDESVGYVAQFHPDGTPDPTFGSGGFVAVNLDGALINDLTSVGVLPDGRVVVGANIGVIDVAAAFFAFHPDGELDLSFGGSEGVRPFGGRSSVSDLVVLPDGRILSALYENGSYFGRFNPDGSLDPTFGDDGLVRVASVSGLGVWMLALLPDGRFYGAGGFEGKMAVARFLNGSGVTNESDAIPVASSLSVYPNPSAGSAVVTVALPHAAEVRVVVYDVLGREVAMLAGERMEAGVHAFDLNGARLPAGLYLVRATGDGIEATQRITVLR